MANKKRNFRNILIEPAFQIKLLSYFIYLFFLLTLSLYSTIYLFFFRLKQKALNVGIPPEHVFFRFISNEKADMDLMFIGLALFHLLLLIGLGFVVSHRIAGPIFKLKRYLKEEIKSDAPQFRLRKKDFLRDFEPIVNALKDRIRD